MKYKLTNLIDIKQFQRLLESFYVISEIPHGLLDPDGNILSGIGWQNICTKFHRVNTKSALNCKKSDLSIKDKLNFQGIYNMYQCKNGLMEAFIPVIVEGEHIATLILGQFLFSTPDIEYFRKQAQIFDFDENTYLKALSQVPIISKEELNTYMNYFFEVSKILSSLILKGLNQKKNEALLKEHNTNLEKIVVARTAQLTQMNTQIEKKERKLKETIAFDQLRTEFFANLSHEIKTPINLISSVIQLLELEMKSNEISLSSVMDRRLNILKQNSNRLLKLTNNLIDVTKIDCGYLKLNLQNCNIINIIENITLSVADYIKNKNMELLFDTTTEEIITAIDPTMIERIMLNLLSNAVKFTNPGGKIIVNITNSKKEIILSIKDTGIGIPKDQLDLIFNPFRQVNKSLTRSHEGSGMGLSIVKSLVNMHQGTIMAKSKHNKGSEFIITFPIKKLPSIENTSECYPLDYSKNTHIEIINIEFSDIYS